MLPLDLHVLGLSLAFILSQDQTLRCNIIFLLFFTLKVRPNFIPFNRILTVKFKIINIIANIHDSRSTHLLLFSPFGASRSLVLLAIFLSILNLSKNVRFLNIFSECNVKTEAFTGHWRKISSVWALTDSNRRPSACKADALNQLS